MRAVQLILLTILSLTVIAHADMLTEKWKFNAENSVVGVEISPLEARGRESIIAATSQETLSGGFGNLYALDRFGNMLMEGNLPGPVSDMVVDDLNGDGIPEIMVGVYSYIHVFNKEGGNWTKKWKSRTGYQYRIMDLAVGDLDLDGSKEVAVVAGTRSKNGVYIFDFNGNVKWATSVVGRPYSVEITDLDNDGTPEVLVGTVGGRTDPSFNYAGVVYVFNSNGEKRWEYRTERGVASITAADLDGDGKKEILAGSYPELYVLSSEGNSLWNYSTGGRIRKILVDDLNADGEPEIILGSNNVFALDRNGVEKWSNPVGSEVYELKAADLDQDGKKELLVGSTKFYVLDSEGKSLMEFSTGGLSIKSIATGDLDKDDYLDVVLGSIDHNVYLLQSKEHVLGGEADKKYLEAKNSYTTGKYQEAMTLAQEAKKLYSELGMTEMVVDVENFIPKVEKGMESKGEKLLDAHYYYEMAQNLSMSGDYGNASEYATKAKYKYMDLNEEEMVKNSNSILEKSNQILALDASSLYENASRLYDSRDYQKAMENALKSRDYYEWLKNGEGLLNIDLLLARLYYKLAEDNAHRGYLETASELLQRSRHVFICLQTREGFPGCDPKTAEIKDIGLFAGEIVNKTYNDSKYQKELLEINSLARRISTGGTGFKIDISLDPLLEKLKSLKNSIVRKASGISRLYLLIGALLLLILFVILVVAAIIAVIIIRKRKKEKVKPQEKKVPPPEKKEEEEEEPPIKKPVIVKRVERKRERREIPRIKKDTAREEGSSLRGLGVRK